MIVDFTMFAVFIHCEHVFRLNVDAHDHMAGAPALFVTFKSRQSKVFACQNMSDLSPDINRTRQWNSKIDHPDY